MADNWVRDYCMSFPHVTETIQWGNDLVFKVGGKMFAVHALDPGANWLAFKCTDENFAELTEREGIIPAPYLARAMWVALQNSRAMSPKELKPLLKEAYDIVFAKLPRRTQKELGS